MHSINGYVFGNGPMFTMHKGERVRWYVMSTGTEVDLHTPHWHGNTVLVNGMRMDTVSLLPAGMIVADMKPDNPGIWLFHCHVNDHLTAGMIAATRSSPNHSDTVPATSGLALQMDDAPQPPLRGGHGLCTGGLDTSVAITVTPNSDRVLHAVRPGAAVPFGSAGRSAASEPLRASGVVLDLFDADGGDLVLRGVGVAIAARTGETIHVVAGSLKVANRVPVATRPLISTGKTAAPIPAADPHHLAIGDANVDASAARDLEPIGGSQARVADRPVIVPALNWKSLRPVMRTSGYSRLGCSEVGGIDASQGCVRRRAASEGSRCSIVGPGVVLGRARPLQAAGCLEPLVADARARRPHPADLLPDSAGRVGEQVATSQRGREEADDLPVGLCAPTGDGLRARAGHAVPSS